MFALIALYAIFGLAFTMSKGVLNYAYPLFFVGLRMVLAGFILLGYHVFFKKKPLTIDKRYLSIFAQIAFFHVFVTYAFEFWALEYVSAAKDALFFNLTPFITALLSLVLCKEYLTIRQWLGLAIGFIGFIPMFIAQNGLTDLTKECLKISWPEICILIAVSASAYGWILMQRLVKNTHYDPVFINGMTMLWGGILSYSVAWFMEPAFFKTITGTVDQSYDMGMFAWYTAVLILLTNIISYNLYGSLLRVYSATFMALAAGMTPLFTALFDWLLFGEYVTWHFVLTVILVFIGLAIFYSDEFKSPKVESTILPPV